MLLRWLLGELYLQSWKWQEPHPSTDQDQAVCEWKSLYERREVTPLVQPMSSCLWGLNKLSTVLDGVT